MNRNKGIEWCQNPDGSLGWIWNPITGCLNGCEYCYARKLANTRLRSTYLANRNFPFPLMGDELLKAYADPFYPRFWEGRLYDGRDELCGGKPKGVFVCDMSDLFGIGVPEDWTRRVLDVIESRSQHRFYLLTKQPQNLQKFSPFPDNCWVGVSATDYTMANQARYYLSLIKAKVKYLSIEPFLEPFVDRVGSPFQPEYIDWVIIGSQTKPYKPPKIEWVQEIVQACDKAGIPVFLKKNIVAAIPAGTPDGLFYKGIHLRQDMPSA